jgi:hypothetical protein
MIGGIKPVDGITQEEAISTFFDNLIEFTYITHGATGVIFKARSSNSQFISLRSHSPFTVVDTFLIKVVIINLTSTFQRIDVSNSLNNLGTVFIRF